MIEIKVEKSTCEHGASIFTASPEEICIGGINAAGVDKIHVTVPEEWAGCTVRITFNPHHAPRYICASGILLILCIMRWWIL